MESNGDNELKQVRDWMVSVLDGRPDLTATAWAKRANMAATNVTRHVNPKPGMVLYVPKPRTIRALARAAGVPAPAFAGGGDDYESEIEGEDTPASGLPTSTPVDGTIRIPEYDIKLSAGGGVLIDREDIKANWSFARDYITRELRLNPSSLSMVEVTGDSMSPKLLPSDRILVNHADTNPTPPGVFALWDGYGLVVKNVQRVHRSEPEKLLLISENPIYPPYEVLTDEITIIGRVVWCGRRM